MIPYQQDYNATVAQRYLRLAGPFDERTQCILEGMRRYLGATGARTVTVGEADGVCLWRLRSECETLEETERRLRRLRAQASGNRSQGAGVRRQESHEKI